MNLAAPGLFKLNPLCHRLSKIASTVTRLDNSFWIASSCEEIRRTMIATEIHAVQEADIVREAEAAVGAEGVNVNEYSPLAPLLLLSVWSFQGLTPFSEK